MLEHWCQCIYELQYFLYRTVVFDEQGTGTAGVLEDSSRFLMSYLYNGPSAKNNCLMTIVLLI